MKWRWTLSDRVALNAYAFSSEFSGLGVMYERDPKSPWHKFWVLLGPIVMALTILPKGLAWEA